MSEKKVFAEMGLKLGLDVDSIQEAIIEEQRAREETIHRNRGLMV